MNKKLVNRALRNFCREFFWSCVPTRERSYYMFYEEQNFPFVSEVTWQKLSNKATIKTGNKNDIIIFPLWDQKLGEGTLKEQ